MAIPFTTPSDIIVWTPLGVSAVGSFVVDNVDTDVMDYVISGVPTWATVDPLTGSISWTGTATHNVSYFCEAFPPGIYGNDLLISSVEQVSGVSGLTFEPKFLLVVGNYPISSLSGGATFQWKSDIFSNQYELLKDMGVETRYVSNYDKRQATGELWMRDQRGKVRPLWDNLPSLYAILTSDYSYFQAYNDMVDNAIRNFDIFYDTLMIQTTSHLIFQKINYDYDTGVTDAHINEFHLLPLSGRRFAGTWFLETEKKVTVCLTELSSVYVIPHMYSLDLETNRMDPIFGPAVSSDFSALSDMPVVGLTSIQDPVLTYNDLTKTYNVACIGLADGRGTGMVFTSMNLKDLGDYPTIESSFSIVPVTTG